LVKYINKEILTGDFMSLDTFKKELNSIFENCNYEEALKEEVPSESQMVPFTYNSPEGITYQVQMNPTTKEYKVFQDGKQVDIFNSSMLDQDGGINKNIRKGINDEAQRLESGKAPVPVDVTAPEEPVPQKTEDGLTKAPVSAEVPKTPGAPEPTLGVEQPIAEVANSPSAEQAKQIADMMTGGKGDERTQAFIEYALDTIAAGGEESLKAIINGIIEMSRNPISERADLIKKFVDQYGEKGKNIFYATMNKRGLDPETGHPKA
jgi:hypothetical protein